MAVMDVCVLPQEFDVPRVTVRELEFEAPFQLTVQQDTDCHVRPQSSSHPALVELRPLSSSRAPPTVL